MLEDRRDVFQHSEVAMPLTDVECRSAKRADRPYKLTDSGGLQLWIATTGVKTWRYAYRSVGKQKSLALGLYPEVRLVEARDKRDKAKRLLRENVVQTAPAEAARSYSFKEVALEWHGKRQAKWCEGHRERILRRLEVNAFPFIGDSDVSSLDAPTILEVLRKIEARNAVDMAKRVKQTIGCVMRYAVATSRIAHDPTVNLRDALVSAPKVRHHAALREKEVGPFLEKLDAYDGHVLTRLAIAFTLQTMVRTTETRLAVWSEFEEIDGRAPLWRIPGTRMKNGREHLVPLAPQTAALLKNIRRYSSRSRWVFPGQSKDGTMSVNTMIFALYRMGYHSRLTVHGFRGTASTYLNERGFNRDWIERQLSHIDEDEVRSAYNSAEYISGRRQMVAHWCDFLDAQRKDTAGDPAALFDDLLS
jgi:integrase